MNDLPTASISVEQAISITLLTPMDDPHDATCRWGLPLMLWGSPGIGKSERVEGAARATGMHLEEIFSGGHPPEDFAGTGMRIGDTIRRMCTLDEVHRLNEAKRGILFFDELSCAPPAVQAALLKVILKRYIGGTYLAPGIRLIAAANPVGEAADGFELPPPLSNRFVHINVTRPCTEDWAKWRLRQWTPEMFDMKNGEALVKKNWDIEMSKAEALFASYVQARGGDPRAKFDVLYNLPPEGNPARGQAWTSPRTLDFATRLTATCNCLAVPITDYHDLLVGAIGEGSARELITWLMANDLPSPEDVLLKGWSIDTVRIDRTFAVFNAVSTYILRIQDKKKQIPLAANAWKLYEAAFDAGVGDAALWGVTALVNNQLGITCPQLTEVCRATMSKCKLYAEIHARSNP